MVRNEEWKKRTEVEDSSRRRRARSRRELKEEDGECLFS